MAEPINKNEDGWIVSDELLQRCHERAPIYDRKNRFCQEDFDELKEAGYLKMAIPTEMGGYGMTLHEICQETRRLAYWAPATALCINMHTYWCGVARTVHDLGDNSMDWLLEEAAAGEVFAAGHAESGNTVPLLTSTTEAIPVEGGYKFTGRKGFGSLTPVWTRLGLHGQDNSDPENPKIIHAFMARDTENYTIKETWDVLGMRATRSDDTIFEEAFVPNDYIARVVPAGAGGADIFVLGIFAWALAAFGNIYYGVARRITDITIESLKKKTGPGLTRTAAYHPENQHKVADMVLDLEAMEAQLDRLTTEWSEGVDHGGMWVLKIVATKHNVVEAAWRVADNAMDASGGFGMFKKTELERLYRDCRAGRFHPANANLTREIVSKIALGIDLDEQPRWG
jgi:alkylation response protein AidB-like acyl-CoA dehydrogenase